MEKLSSMTMTIEKSCGIKYTICVFFSSMMKQQQIEDFIWVQNQVFTENLMTKEDFKIKFLQNIYGDSVLVITYDENGKPAAARALWRNDIAGKIAYQPSDTAVCAEHRKRGLFVDMTKAALEKVDPAAIIYNFPNSNSYPQYIKLGWEDYKVQYTRIFNPWSYSKENHCLIDSDYLQWWIQSRINNSYGYTKIFGRYYLVRILNEKKRALVFGEITQQDAMLFNKVKPHLIVYHSNKKKFYAKKIACRIVALGKINLIEIPGWKTDVF